MKSRKLRVIKPGTQSFLRANRSVSVVESQCVKMCDKHARMSINTIISRTSNRNDSVISKLKHEKEQTPAQIRIQLLGSFNSSDKESLGMTIRRRSIQGEAIEMVSIRSVGKIHSSPYNDLMLSKCETESLITTPKKDGHVQTANLKTFSYSLKEVGFDFNQIRALSTFYGVIKCSISFNDLFNFISDSKSEKARIEKIYVR